MKGFLILLLLCTTLLAPVTSTQHFNNQLTNVMTKSVLSINDVPVLGPIDVIHANKSVIVVVPLWLIYECSNILAEWITLNAYQNWKFFIIISDFAKSAEELRNILRELHYRENISGVILIGNTNLYEQSEITFSFFWETYPMDLYLMDLDGEYVDSDNDDAIDRFYDPDDAGPADIYPEIFIGRIHPSNRGDLSFIENVLLKSIKVIGGEIPTMFNACLFIDDDWIDFYDEISSWFTPIYNVTVIYNTSDTTSFTFIDLIHKKWGLFYQAIHSNGTHLFIICDDTYYILSNNDIVKYGIGGQIEILFSCSAADYTISRYLAEAYLRDNITVAVISSTKAGGIWYADSLISELKEGKTLGEAFMCWFTDVIQYWESNPDFWYNQSWWAGMTIIGDPLFSLYPKFISLNDKDDDGLVDEIELLLGTNPYNDDTDHDGMNDAIEMLFGFNPLDRADANVDFDNDNLTNVEEIHLKINPYDNDTDNDGMLDGWEVKYELNPRRNDSWKDFDGDNLTNLEEYQHNTNPRNNDTDHDGMPDGWEVKYELNPRRNDANEDPDGDWLKNIDEYRYNANPHNGDTDGDGFSDFIEVLFNTNPRDREDTPLLIIVLLIFAPILIIMIMIIRKHKKQARKK